jgi:hypothetical protein
MGTFRVTPGYVSGSSAKGLNEMAAQSDKVRADMERMKVAMSGDFPAKLTAYDSITGFYSWTRRAFDGDRVRYDFPEAATGTPTNSPARTINGEVIDVTTPVDVWLRPIGTSATVGTVHEVVAYDATKVSGGSGGGIEFLEEKTLADPVVSAPTGGAYTTHSSYISFSESGIYWIQGTIFARQPSLIASEQRFISFSFYRGGYFPTTDTEIPKNISGNAFLQQYTLDFPISNGASLPNAQTATINSTFRVSAAMAPMDLDLLIYAESTSTSTTFDVRANLGVWRLGDV